MESDDQNGRLLGEFKRYVTIYLYWLGYSERFAVEGLNKAVISDAAERFVAAGLLALKGENNEAHVVPRTDVARMLGVTVQTVARYGKLGYIRPVVRNYSRRVMGYELKSVREYLERYVKEK